jgi:hypothetical protein
LIFVEQSAEEVAPPDLQRMNHRCGRRIDSVAALRRSQVERSVWTLLVEVADVDAEDVLAAALARPRGAAPVNRPASPIDGGGDPPTRPTRRLIHEYEALAA